MKISKQKQRGDASQAGITLLEVIIAMTVVGILAGFISQIVYYEVNLYNSVVNRADGLQAARKAMQMMSFDIRHIASPESIFHASSDSIRFDDIDDAMISYKFINGQVFRNNDLLLNQVQDLQFQYFDDGGSSLSSPVSSLSNIGSISMDLITQINGQPFSFSTKIQPRNF